MIVETLADHARSHRVYAVCESCDRTVELDLSALIRQHGQDTPLDSVKARLRCRECGAKAKIIIAGRGMAS